MSRQKRARSIQETVEFVEGHDLAEIWNQLEPVDPGLFRPRVELLKTPKDRQLNIRIDGESLDLLKRVAFSKRVGYHTLARMWIVERLGSEAAALELADVPPASGDFPGSQPRPSLTELSLALLEAPGRSGQPGEAIEGMTRLQKLLFLAAQRLGSSQISQNFEAYHFGPFDEQVYETAESFQERGLVARPHGWNPPARGEKPSFQEILSVVQASGSPEAVRDYKLTEEGLRVARKFLDRLAQADPGFHDRLVSVVREVKERFGSLPLGDLLAYVYREYPEFAEKSTIKTRVEKAEQRHTDVNK